MICNSPASCCVPVTLSLCPAGKCSSSAASPGETPGAPGVPVPLGALGQGRGSLVVWPVCPSCASGGQRGS